MSFTNKILFVLITGIISCKSINLDRVKNCNVQEIKYLTTYSDSRMWEFAGGESIIDSTSLKDIASITDEQLKGMHFFTPILIKKIKIYNSDSVLDETENEIIIELSRFFKRIWKNEIYEIKEHDSKVEVCKKINLIIDKYHQLSEDDSEFYKMIYTLDDGPFFGIDTESELDKIKEISIGENRLILRGNGAENTLEILNKSSELLWRKIIAQSESYKIERLDFAGHPVRVDNELGYKVALIGNGELIHLYLRKNGSFRLFFHSW